jgi:hypothetical protein
VKVLVGLLISAVLAVYLNISPLLPKQAVFFNGYETTEGSIKYPYYKVAEAELNWKDINSAYFNVISQTATGCDATPRIPAEASKVSFYKNQAGIVSSKYWIQANAVDADMTRFVPTATEELIAPEVVTIVTQSGSLAAYDGTMELKGEGGIIIFNNLKCWYCCTTHGPDEDGVYRHIGSNRAKAGTELPAGYVIGVSAADTAVSFRSLSGRPLTIEEYYTGIADSSQ